MTRWRDWTGAEETRARERAAYLFLNMVRCTDCGLPWPEGYEHPDCPGPKPHESFCSLFEDHPGECRTLTARTLTRVCMIPACGCTGEAHP